MEKLPGKEKDWKCILCVINTMHAGIALYGAMPSLFLPQRPNSVFCKSPTILVASAGPVKSLDLKLGLSRDYSSLYNQLKQGSI